MVLQIDQVFRALKRHRTAATIIALAIALATTILSNSMFNVVTRLQTMAMPTGLPEDQLAFVEMTGDRDPRGASFASQAVSDLLSVRGVSSATVANILPFGGVNFQNDVGTTPDQNAQNTAASQYMVSEGGLKTFGIKLITGRDFNAEEYVDLGDSSVSPAHVTILSADVATKLFDAPAAALGKIVYIGDRSYTVVGVSSKFAGAYPHPSGESFYAMIFPTRVASNTAVAIPFFVMRCKPTLCDSVLQEASRILRKDVPRLSLIQATTVAKARSAYYSKDSDAVTLLVAVSSLLLLVTALGIVGLASFWVEQRKRQIGVRRALGATRSNILRYFQVENFLVVSLGVGLGMMGAYGLSILLMRFFETSSLPLWYMPLTAVTLWLLGQLAVLAPALHASRVSPIEATRS